MRLFSKEKIKFVSRNLSKITWWVILVVMLVYSLKMGRWNNAKETGKIIDWDVVSYYSYLPAIVIHGDLSLKFLDDEKAPLKYKSQFWPQTAPNGNKVIKTTMGMAVMYSPFFLLGHTTALLSENNPDGFSKPYEFFLVIACLFYLMLGLYFLRKILLLYFSEQTTSITLFVVLFATNLFHYTTQEPGMSHAYSFSLICIFLYQTIAWYKSPSKYRALYVGLIGGLIVLIRPVNILIFIIPLFYGIKNVQDFKERIQLWKSHFLHLIILGLSVFLVVLPQLVYWKWSTGNWLFNSYIGEQFYFNNPHIWEGLFSYRKGWLLYTPIMGLALIGVILSYRKRKDYFLALSFFTAIFIFVSYSWWCWWYGGGFGSRSMVDMYGLFSIPLALTISIFIRKGWIAKTGLALLLMFFVFFNYFQTTQYRRTLIHWDSMTKEAYWYIFLKDDLSDSEKKVRDSYLSSPDYEKALKGMDEY